ncbi:hypothetical protein BVRB_2g030540 [Beta vulgaris subsp. vulgaris]|nr:hypothetical protein BVRB_2g030540 [Beta vulgaris subsp. vulgaris]
MFLQHKLGSPGNCGARFEVPCSGFLLATLNMKII